MFISLDLETTGVDSKKDKIIEFGAIKFDLTGEKEQLRFLINPEIELPEIITHITGIRDEDLSSSPKFPEKIEEIKNFIGDLPIIGHNIKFDTGFLRENGIKIDNPEYDTCQLASILLPGLPSYSLEILSHKLNLKHKEKHRALDDAIAAMELFIKLAEEFSHLKKPLFLKIKNLCKKTDWELKNFLTQLEAKNKKNTTNPSQNPTSKTKPANKPDHKHSMKILKTKTSALFEIAPPYKNLIRDLLNKIDKDSYISVPNQVFNEICNSLPDTIAKIDSPSKYLSLERLKKFEKKAHFKKYEFTALLKILIWQEQTETGHLDEMTFFNEEREVIPSINIQANEKNEHFFKKALKKDDLSPAVCSHRYTIEKNPKAKELIIINPEKFIESIAFNTANYLKLDILQRQLENLGENKTLKSLSTLSTMIFGLIGILFDKHNDRNEYLARCKLNKEIIESSTGRDIYSSIIKLIESSKELLKIKGENNEIELQNWKSSLKILQDTFLKPNFENNFIWIEKDFSENIVLRSYPYSIKADLRNILENSETFKIIGENLAFNNKSDFIKGFLDLDPLLPFINLNQKREDLQIFITKDSVETFLKEYLSQKRGKTAIIFNSKQQLKLFTLKLGKHLREKDIKIVSQMTGSLGKLKEQFTQDPDNSILFITPNFFENFKKHKLIENLIIHKIPFDPPSIPFIITTSTHYNNPFMEFQIPKAVFTIKKLINLLPDTTKQKEVILLDPRLIEKEYGQVIIDNLRSLATTKIVNPSMLSSNVKGNT